ncbi:MAG TPA: hypothetical protein VGE62_02090 [Candidatus Paceibacterota bacterium]
MNANVISSADIDRGLVDGIIAVYKQPGETPLECLGRLEMRFPALKNVPLSYAGRLDPLASGVMLVLSGSFNKMRQEYLSLDKEYEVRVLFGISTDTGDLMGMFTGGPADLSASENIRLRDEKGIKIFLSGLKGPFSAPYPAYSSKTVQGKPLFQWASEGKLDEIDMPMQHSEIHSVDLIDSQSVTGKEVAVQAMTAIEEVSGEFRQKEILSQWSEFLALHGDASFREVRMRVRASSGTYMRSLAEHIGSSFGTKAVASEIVRTEVGGIKIDQAIVLV